MTAAVSSAASTIASAVRSGLDAVQAPLTGSSNESNSKRKRSAVSLTAPTPNNIGQVRKLNSVLFPVRYSEKWYKDILKADNLALSRIGLFNDIPVGLLAARYEQASTHAPEIGGVNIYLMTLGVLAPYRRRGLASELLRNLLSVVRPGSQTPPIVGGEVVVPLPVKETVPTPAENLPEPAVHVPLTAEEEEEKKKKEAKANGGATAAAGTKNKGAATATTADSSPTLKRYRYAVQTVYLHVQTSNPEARAFYESHGFTMAREIKEYYRKGVEPQSAWLLELRA
ncbi:unnamed protein product [Tilletia controversa]|uniref:N-acetyltransferase domain-containing protein n=2 Tax=Tilletia TaxID=13289 RepID=A0A177V733_9BASI|nr:hypothetical protein CF336_g6168 [Tilletia laevis]KAE8256169.1 hypothetical protein A4X03_0g5459 [Tilletia caries]CAD6961783.1 unnamed protein product [Tilletia controversa]KAE8193660.1 hypothetical protein CF335_g5533 [Tilletia laevis]CAD6884410.1 unnamed protein product [Tilletia caries]